MCEDTSSTRESLYWRECVCVFKRLCLCDCVCVVGERVVVYVYVFVSIYGYKRVSESGLTNNYVMLSSREYSVAGIRFGLQIDFCPSHISMFYITNIV